MGSWFALRRLKIWRTKLAPPGWHCCLRPAQERRRQHPCFVVCSASATQLQASKAQDARILQLVLQLEYTQVAFYEEALSHASLEGQLRDFAETAAWA